MRAGLWKQTTVVEREWLFLRCSSHLTVLFLTRGKARARSEAGLRGAELVGLLHEFALHAGGHGCLDGHLICC